MRFLVIGYGNAAGEGRGLYSCELERATQTLHQLDYVPLDVKPGGALQVGPYLWVTYRDASRTEDGVMIYQIHRDGSLHWLHNRVLPAFFSSLIAGPTADRVLAASFHDGLDAVLDARNPGVVLGQYQHPFRPRSTDDRQQAAHSHFIGILPHQQCVYSVDLGIDQVLFYPSYAQTSIADSVTAGPVSTLDCPFGSGPRLMPCATRDQAKEQRPCAYLLHEIANTVSVLQWHEASDTAGQGQWLECQQVSTLAPGFSGQSSAAGCKLTPDERYLVVSNRGENSLVLYRRNAMTGLLDECDRQICGAIPRDIWVTDSDVLVLAQQANYVEWFRLDTQQHCLQRKSAQLPIPAPVGICELIY